MKSGINKTRTYDEIDQSLLPSWAGQQISIFSPEENVAQVIEWIQTNPELAFLFNEPALALMLVRHNFIGAYYQSLPPTDKRSYAEFKRRLAVISAFNLISDSTREANAEIKLLKDEQKNK